jgi:hypothetical protein
LLFYLLPQSSRPHTNFRRHCTLLHQTVRTEHSGLVLYDCILTVCLCMTTLTDVFPCFFLNFKANARVKPAKTGHGQHYSKFLFFLCVFLYFVVLCIVCVCICVLYYCHRVATQLQLNISYQYYALYISTQTQNYHKNILLPFTSRSSMWPFSFSSSQQNINICLLPFVPHSRHLNILNFKSKL